MSADIFNLWISHGKKAVDGEYAYMVVPDKTLSEFQTFVSTQTFNIVQNTTAVQAVRVNNLYAVVFHCLER